MTFVEAKFINQSQICGTIWVASLIGLVFSLSQLGSSAPISLPWVRIWALEIPVLVARLLCVSAIVSLLNVRRQRDLLLA